VHGHAADVVADELALARVDANAHLDAQIARRPGDRQRAAQRARRGAVERREEAVADGLDLAPFKARELLAHLLVVAREQVAPAPVAERRRVRRRVDDVGEHHRQQRARELAAGAPAREELLDLFEDRVAVADEGKRIDALQLDIARAGDVLGEIARVADIPHQLLGAVHDERRHADLREHVTHVEVDHRARDDARLARACGQALHACEPRSQRAIVGHRRGPQRHPRVVRGAPLRDVALGQLFALLGGHRPVVVRSPGGA
jgi:hypothetical protein